MKQVLIASAVFCAMFALSRSASAQQPMVFTTTPLQANGDRFFESTNMSWSLRGPNFFATFGGPNVGIPRFGGYNPNAGISSGWAFNSGKLSGNFNFNFSQGYERFSTTTAPSLMTINGQTGQFFSGVRRPFVYSLVPVVPPGGAFFSTPSPAFHQQYRQPTNIAARVLRGDVRLTHSTTEPQNAPAQKVTPDSIVSSDPHTVRASAAYAWFNSSSPVKTTKPQHQPSAVDSALGAIEKPTDKSNENAAAVAARKMEPTQPHTDKALRDSNSERIANVYFQRGLDAEADKDLAKARFLFRMAAERASGSLRERIEKHMQSLPPQSP